MGLSVAIVGATGAVGEEILGVFDRRRFPVDRLRLLASERSAGKVVRFRAEDHRVEALGPGSFEGIDVALFSAGGAVSKELGPVAAAAGALVVDNSSAFRMERGVPLVVPEVNPGEAKDPPRGIIANPNCTTIIALLALAPIHRAAGIERFTAASYQAASGAGARALRELEAQARTFATGGAMEVSVFPRQLFMNCVPHVDQLLDTGYTREEMKLQNESRKILGAPGLRVSATCVRVPVPRSHAVAIHVETREKLTREAAREAIAAAPGVELWDRDDPLRYPTPLDAMHRDEVLVGRVREDPSHERGLSLWVVGDQLLKGAALNAVQCAELALGFGGRSDG